MSANRSQIIGLLCVLLAFVSGILFGVSMLQILDLIALH